MRPSSRARRAAELHPARDGCALPHSTIGHSKDGDPVVVDGQRSDGTLEPQQDPQAVSEGERSRLRMCLADPRRARELYQQHQVLYVYHNRIDATGDKAGTERQVFEAVEETLRELVDLVKRLTNANATNILITADHGFLFQDTALADAFYLSTLPQVTRSRSPIAATFSVAG